MQLLNGVMTKSRFRTQSQSVGAGSSSYKKRCHVCRCSFTFPICTEGHFHRSGALGQKQSRAVTAVPTADLYVLTRHISGCAGLSHCAVAMIQMQLGARVEKNFW